MEALMQLLAFLIPFLLALVVAGLIGDALEVHLRTRTGRKHGRF